MRPCMDEPYYVGFNVWGQEVGLDPGGHGKRMTGPVAYRHVAETRQYVRDVGGGG